MQWWKMDEKQKFRYFNAFLKFAKAKIAEPQTQIQKEYNTDNCCSIV